MCEFTKCQDLDQNDIRQIVKTQRKLKTQNSTPTGERRKDSCPTKRSCGNFRRPLLKKTSRDPHMKSNLKIHKEEKR